MRTLTFDSDDIRLVGHILSLAKVSHWAHDVIATLNQRLDVDSTSQYRRVPNGSVVTGTGNGRMTGRDLFTNCWLNVLRVHHNTSF